MQAGFYYCGDTQKRLCITGFIDIHREAFHDIHVVNYDMKPLDNIGGISTIDLTSGLPIPRHINQ